MNRRLGALVILVAAGAATAGLFATTSTSAPTLSSGVQSTAVCQHGPLCDVVITPTGPSPSKLTMATGNGLYFDNTDSVTHRVVFANGRCNLTLPPDIRGAYCSPNFADIVGTYAYTVDGKFAGTVVTIPLRRSVTLTARSHAIPRGTRLTLHGRLHWNLKNPVVPIPEPFHVIVLARHDSRRPFKSIASIPVRVPQGNNIWGGIRHGWKLDVRPGVTTTYIAKVTGGTPLYYREEQFWASTKSRPFTVRIRR